MTQRRIEWDTVEVVYRAGIRSLKSIGAEFGVSDAAIVKRAKRDGWTRDLRERIKAKADALVSASAVSDKVSAQSARQSEQAVVEANATMQANLILSHRTDIQRMRRMVLGLLGEVEQESENCEIFEQLAELMHQNEEIGNARLEAIMKAISLPTRVMTVERLSNALTKLVGLEREAFGISKEEAPKDPVDSMTQEEIDAELRALFARMPFIEGEVVRVI